MAPAGGAAADVPTGLPLAASAALLDCGPVPSAALPLPCAPIFALPPCLLPASAPPFDDHHCGSAFVLSAPSSPLDSGGAIVLPPLVGRLDVPASAGAPGEAPLVPSACAAPPLPTSPCGTGWDRSRPPPAGAGGGGSWERRGDHTVGSPCRSRSPRGRVASASSHSSLARGSAWSAPGPFFPAPRAFVAACDLLEVARVSASGASFISLFAASAVACHCCSLLSAFAALW